jgi:hypothetical protein
MAPVLEGKSIESDQKTVLKGELLIWRTKNEARDQGQSNSTIQFASKSHKFVDVGEHRRVQMLEECI